MSQRKKADLLRENGTLNKNHRKLKDPLFKENEFFDPEDLVQVKYEMLRRVSRDGKSITEVTKSFGFSRPVFYEAKDSIEKEGLSGLVPQKPGPRRAHKLNDDILKFIIEKKSQGYRSHQIKEEIKKRFNVDVHPRSVERALARSKKNAN